jgi:hypothetical protein
LEKAAVSVQSGVAKLHKASGKVTFLAYDDFEGKPLPQFAQPLRASQPHAVARSQTGPLTIPAGSAHALPRLVAAAGHCGDPKLWQL